MNRRLIREEPVRGASSWRTWHPWILVLLSLPIIFHGLGSYSVVNGDEAIYHTVAAAMVKSGDWIHLEFHGQPRIYDTFMNAPLQYWARAAVIGMSGNSEWSMRILTALFAVASVLATYRFVHYLCDRTTAFLAGLIQLTTFQFIYLHGARTGELEPVVALLYTLVVFFFIRSIEEGRSFTLHHVCLALLLNVKSPMVLIPLLAEAGCFALLPTARRSFPRFVRSAVLIVPLGLTWHITRLFSLWTPFTAVVREMAGEAIGHGRAVGLDGCLVNVAYYAKTLLFGAFPYSLAFPVALADVLARDRDPQAAFRWRVVALFVLAVLLFFVAVSKHHPWYIMPVYPLLAAFVAHSAMRLVRRRPGVIDLLAMAVMGALAVGLAVPLSDFNPFASMAYMVPMDVHWRETAGIPPAAVFFIVAFALFGGLLATRGVRRGRFSKLVTALLFVGLLSYGAARVLTPLSMVNHRSGVARLSDQLNARLARGEPLDYPVKTDVKLEWDVFFYLYGDYDIVAGPRGSIDLHPKGHAPQALQLPPLVPGTSP